MLEWYVSSAGDDKAAGTQEAPFATLNGAMRAARDAGPGKARTIWLLDGTHYLTETVVITADEQSDAEAPLKIAAADGAKPAVSGGRRLDLTWEAHEGAILKAAVPAGLETDELFVNGRRQHMARYPNYDAGERIFNGYAADSVSPERAARWSNPAGGYIHAMHSHMWGDFHYRITGKDADGRIEYEGGWQNNRRMGMHETYRFVENIFEELDAPGEWFLDRRTDTLYYWPAEGVDMASATVEAVCLRHLAEVRGSARKPARAVRFQGITFRHAARTFMDNREPLLRSDWTCYRGGAVFFEGAEDCLIEDCEFDQVGGNAVFGNGYCRRVAVRGCHIHDTGGNGVAFIGLPDAVRSGLFEFHERNALADIDRTPGPKSPNYPADCLVEDCLICRTGRVEKQTAPVEIDIAECVTVRHCSIYDVPRAGINIGDGCWGGHVVEFCDIFETVKETGDHGSFNSWGRDRFWGLTDVDLDTVTLGELADLPLLDAVKPVILRNSRWRCDHGWDIDLDDGSSHYEIRNNLCLNGGIKLREGFWRVCENNVIVNNSIHPHVWYRNSKDRIRRNIVFTPYRPSAKMVRPYGDDCDHNFLHRGGVEGEAPAEALTRLSGLDENSITADAKFLDAATGDYRVADDSLARKMGFENFSVDCLGVRKPELRAIARTPELPDPANPRTVLDRRPGRKETRYAWLGAAIKNVVGLAEISAGGLPGETGVIVADLPEASELAGLGAQDQDVILRCDNKVVDNIVDLAAACEAAGPEGKVTIEVFRSQHRYTIEVPAGKMEEMTS